MERGDCGAGALVPTGIIILTVTSAVAVYRAAGAVYRAAGDVGSTAFVAGSYAALLLLFRSLRAYERAPPGAVDERERLKRQVWALCTLLTVLFAWKVAAVMPWPVAAVVWALAAATTLGGFVGLFRHP